MTPEAVENGPTVVEAETFRLFGLMFGNIAKKRDRSFGIRRQILEPRQARNCRRIRQQPLPLAANFRLQSAPGTIYHHIESLRRGETGQIAGLTLTVAKYACYAESFRSIISSTLSGEI